MVTSLAIPLKTGVVLRVCQAVFVLTLLLVLLLAAPTLLADVRASLDRHAIQEGDSVTLTILASDESDGVSPDLSVLEKDFDILGTGSSQQTSIINGKHSSSRQWRIDLMPKRQGELTVPAINMGKQTTRVLQLSVTAQPAAAVAQAGESVFIETRIESVDTIFYVQQQIRYVLKLFYRERFYEGSFDEPHVENALVERLGDDKQYQTTVDGQQYQVVERRYAIFPEKSGNLTVPPVTFNGRLAGQSRQRQPATHMSDMMERFFGSSNRSTPGKRVRLRGESITLDIQPRPASYTGQHWLPAEQLVLTDSWAEGPPEFRVGEPVTRSVSLDVKGLEATHLPDLNMQGSEAVRLYPEKPEYTNRTDGEWIYGRMLQTIAYVPSSDGMQTISAIKLDWWDTLAGEQRTTVLPAWTINVMPGDGNSSVILPPPGDRSVGDVENDTEAVLQIDAPTDTRRGLSALPFNWIYIVTAMLLVTAVWLFVHRRNPAAVIAKSSTSALRSARTSVREACRQNDAVRTASTMLQWAALTWPENPPRNLGAISERLQVGDNELAALAQALYGQASQDWQGDALLRVFEQLMMDGQEKSSHGSAKKSALSPLYPDWKT